MENANYDGISQLIDRAHQHFNEADVESYINCFASDGTFFGTDPNECWKMRGFKEYLKKNLKKGSLYTTRSWLKIPLNPECVYLDLELAHPKYRSLRASIIVKKESGEWKIFIYSLSILLPNKIFDRLLKLRKW